MKTSTNARDYTDGARGHHGSLIVPLAHVAVDDIEAQLAAAIAEGHQLFTDIGRMAAQLRHEARLADERRLAAINQRSPDLLSAREIARRLSISPRYALSLMDAGVFGPVFRLGTRRLVATDGYMRYLEHIQEDGA
jgi:hypothetical protein